MDKQDIEKLEEINARSKSNTKRIDELDKRVDVLHSLTLSVERIAAEIQHMREDMNKIDNRVLAIEEKPTKKLDLIWGYIVSAIIGGVIGYILLKLGLK